MMEVSKAEIEYHARQRFGYPATVKPFLLRIDGTAEPWFMLSVLEGTGASRIIGCRRTLNELPALIERGPLELTNAGKTRSVPCRDSRKMF